MNELQKTPQEVKGRRYVVYMPSPFKGRKDKEILDQVIVVAKKLFRGATFSPAGRGVYVSKNKKTGKFEEYDEPVRSIEIITTDVENSDFKLGQFGYAVLCALEEKRPRKNPEKVVWFTEQDIVLHEIKNPDIEGGSSQN